MRIPGSGRPGDYRSTQAAASKLPTGNFACREYENGKKRFLREKSRFCGEPQNAGRSFGRQGISSSVNAAGIPVGCRRSGEMMLPADRQTYLQQTCGEVWPQNGIVHPVHGCVRPPPFGQSPKRRQKRFLISRRQAGSALRRPRRRRISCVQTRFSSYRRSACGIRLSAVPGKFRQSRNVASSEGAFLR